MNLIYAGDGSTRAMLPHTMMVVLHEPYVDILFVDDCDAFYKGVAVFFYDVFFVCTMATVFDAGWLFFDQVGLFKLGGEVFAYFLVDRTGRRPLFLASSSLVTVFLVILGKFMQFMQIVRLKTDHTVHTVHAVYHHLSCMAVVVVRYHTDMEPSHPCRQCRDGVRVRSTSCFYRPGRYCFTALLPPSAKAKRDAFGESHEGRAVSS